MNKKETSKPKEAKNQNYEAKKMNNFENSKRKKDNSNPQEIRTQNYDPK